MSRTNTKKRSSFSGAALAELALIVPVILLIVAGGIEITRALYTRTALLGLSKQVASHGFRSCVGVRDVVNQNDCLLQSINTTWAVFKKRFPGSTIRLRLVHYDPVPTHPNTTVFWNWDGDAVVDDNPSLPADRASRLGAIVSGNSTVMDNYFRATTVSDFPRRDVLLQNQGYMIIGEFYYPYVSIVPPLSRLFGYSGGLFYVRLVY